MQKLESYEKQYLSILSNIYFNGFEDGTNERTGVATKRLPNQIIKVDLKEEFPILKSKTVMWKSAIEEILWIMRDRSNNIKDLRPHIWDEWADKNGSIGKAYGYQVNNPVRIKVKGEIREYPSQVHYVLGRLKEDPSDRRCIITIWNTRDLEEMNLVPCCHTSTWNLDGGRLNCLLDQRSGDFPVGVPFNTTQYAALTYFFARHLGVEPGILLHVIADAHIYDRQMLGVSEQLGNAEEMMNNTRILESKPRLVFAEDAPTNFWHTDISKISVEGYENMGKVSFGEIVV